MKHYFFVLRIGLFMVSQLGLPVPNAYGQPADLWAAAPSAPASDLSQLLTDLEELRARHARTQTEAHNLTESIQQVKNALTTHTRSLVRLKGMGALPLAGGVEAMQAHSARLRRLERLVQHDLQQMRSLQAYQTELHSTAQQLAQAIAKHEQQLSGLQYDSTTALQLPVSQIPDDLGTWGKSSDSINDFGLKLHDAPSTPAPAIEGFAKLRGSLQAPVDGHTELRAAKRPESEGPGLEFIVAAGTAVRAVASGRVAFADRYGSYGRIIILDHGDRYYTVYGGLGAYSVRVGDSVSQGARMGTVGSSTNPPALFFEVRLGTRTLDARPWLQVE